MCLTVTLPPHQCQSSGRCSGLAEDIALLNQFLDGNVAVLNPFLRIYLFEGEFFPSPFLHRDSGFQVGREDCIHCLPSLFWRRKSFENQPPLLPLMFCASSVILNLVRGVGV